VLQTLCSNDRPRRRQLHDGARVPGIDMRTSDGRRHSRIADALIRDFGDVDPVRLRELAGLKFTAEKTQAAFVGGDMRASADLIRLRTIIAQIEADLRSRAGSPQAEEG
jgi:hypothetical protein